MGSIKNAHRLFDREVSPEKGGDESISILHVSLLVINGNSVDVLIISLSYIWRNVPYRQRVKIDGFEFQEYKNLLEF
jgi:hypothetical protein